MIGVKLKPVLIGSAANPRCFKNVNKNNLPFFYHSNKNAWMTNIIFSDWLDKINKKFKHENRNVLLLVDNFSGHKLDKYLYIKVFQRIAHLYCNFYIFFFNKYSLKILNSI